jgi:hypothetical protein
MSQTHKTGEAMFFLAIVLSGTGLAMAVFTSGFTAPTVILFAASAIVLAGGVAAEMTAFLRPRRCRDAEHASIRVDPVALEGGESKQISSRAGRKGPGGRET